MVTLIRFCFAVVLYISVFKAVIRHHASRARATGFTVSEILEPDLLQHICYLPSGAMDRNLGMDHITRLSYFTILICEYAYQIRCDNL